MATYSSNTTIKSSPTSINTGGSGTNSSIYVAPSNGYAIVQVTAATGMVMTVDTVTIPMVALSPGSTQGATGIYVGSGRNVAISGSGSWTFSGVEFKNSP